MSVFNFLVLRLSSQAANIQLLTEKQFLDTQSVNKFLALKNSRQLLSSPYNSFDYSNSKKLSAESAYRFAKLNPYNRTLFKDLIEKYWQQSVFLSSFNPTTDKYIAKLARQRSAITKEKQKRFFMDFSKALVSDPIKASGITARFSDNLEDSPPIKYIWKKGLNFQKPKSWPIVSLNKSLKSNSQKINLKLLQNLNNSHLSLYVIVNGFKQMIISGPPNDFSNKETFTNRLRHWYHNTFLEHNHEHAIYQAWFFINPKDALEYKEFMSTKSYGSSTESPLGILPSKFDFYYRLNRNFLSRTEFRLFPDLEEVENILYNSKHRKNLIFDSRQNIGGSYFQGQPIYFIEPTKCIIKGNRQVVNFIPRYQMLHDSLVEEYNPIFLTKRSALNAWKDIHEKYPEYGLPLVPQLRLYNLEDFLKDNESQQNIQSFILMPGPSSSIHDLKSLQLVNSQEKFQDIEGVSSPCILACRLWIQRLAWSLTRRKPPQWEV